MTADTILKAIMLILLAAVVILVFTELIMEAKKEKEIISQMEKANKRVKRKVDKIIKRLEKQRHG